ncbi:type I 3-dehydroquinate dehydratase [Fibrobacter sp.]|uniref:type I 3-dehydroquinate dehydratase n=1 Tax=Fibrobacter sp. TaxID=35828 RepID=UPI0025BC5EA7|nr:type I 3-dehydroquinate dehydratase [Fibrobacter sp.]MCI6437252.1 type I 3-dehydroquinate dehydratase [Fibrobacter sp.]MDD7498359.1 type I 3-dehydroquinate dehydratase [Fibrobacter sp.]MDY5723486.1 type I 3-dehydroquinate dehydratase [Fibrobacter sp.]
MISDSPKYLVGLVGPEVLEAAEKDLFHAVRLDLDACGAIEIRYDFFKESDWVNLSERVRNIVPDKLQIGTVRLKRDGGRFPDARSIERTAMWEKVLGAKQVPEWLDLERDCLSDFKALNNMARPKGTSILVSEHNFVRIPSEMELEAFADDVKRVGAQGLKIAAMSNSDCDSDRLYKFARKFAKKFQMFAAFGMGETGKVSRLWSLKEGANLTYGSIGRSEAPGQIDVSVMGRALDQFDSLNSQMEILAFLNQF